MDEELDYGGGDEDMFEIMVDGEVDDLLGDLKDVPVTGDKRMEEAKKVGVLERAKKRIEEDKKREEDERKKREKEKKRREEERRSREEKRRREEVKKKEETGGGRKVDEPLMSGEMRRRLEEEKRRMEVMKKRRLGMDGGGGGEGPVERRKKMGEGRMKKKAKVDVEVERGDEVTSGVSDGLVKEKKKKMGEGRMKKKVDVERGDEVTSEVSDGVVEEKKKVDGERGDEVTSEVSDGVAEEKKKKGGGVAGRLVLGHVLVKQRRKRKREEEEVKEKKKAEETATVGDEGNAVEEKMEDDKVGLVVTQDGDEEWMVEKILKKKVGKDGVALYKIKWVGWDSKYNTWEPVEHLGNCPELMKEFEGKEKRRMKRKREKEGTDEEEIPVLDYYGGEGAEELVGGGGEGDGVGNGVDPDPPNIVLCEVEEQEDVRGEGTGEQVEVVLEEQEDVSEGMAPTVDGEGTGEQVEVVLEETRGNVEMMVEVEVEETGGEQVVVVEEKVAPVVKKPTKKKGAARKVNWVEREAQAQLFGGRFRRLWRREETPLCVLGGSMFNGSLLLLVRLKPESEEETLKVLEDPDKDLETDDTTYVYTPSKHFGRVHPQLLIKFYESCFKFIEKPKDEDKQESETTAAATATTTAESNSTTNTD